MEELKVFSAGVAMGVAKDTAEKWNSTHPEFPVKLTFGGSVDLIRRVLAGEDCDILILADNTIIENMMMPDVTGGYVIFAANKMVIAATPGNSIDSDNWREKLLAPDAKFMHMNPYGDPGGYRAVLAMLLADKVEEGLSEKLMNHPGHIGMDPTLTRENMPPFNYMFTYYSGAKKRGMVFAELPAIMDLSDEALNDVYSSVSFAVDEEHTVKGSAIFHALTIPYAAKNPVQAKEFADQFLASDFNAYGFSPAKKTVGKF
jgi:ABC-type molybdate transport system substrate-binding protein